METSSGKNREILAEQFACQRRHYNRLWLKLAVGIALTGVISWFYTGNIETLYGWSFFAIFPLLGLVYTSFLLKPQRDPFETQQRSINLAEKYRKNLRSTGLLNGSLMMIVSPFAFALGVAGGMEEHGVVGAILGALFGVMIFAAGLAGVLWRND